MKKASLICTLLLFITVAFANNVQVNTVSYNGSAQTVTFTLSWENSWDLPTGSPPSNHDAVWVFIKCKTGGDTWSHGLLSTTASAHTTGSSLTLAQPSALNQYGVLIKRSTQGFGNIEANNTVSLQLTAPANITAIQVFAVEMVYIAEGSFEIGNPLGYGVTVTETFSQYTITSENLIPTSALLINTIDVPATFPKGYKAFYLMKYEISQGQYTDFLNSLTRTQQQQRVASDISGTSVTNQYVMSNQAVLTEFNHIQCGASIPATGSISFSCAVPEKACNYLGWADFASYLDWSGLRPMTTFEYEKACRGFEPHLKFEFPWRDTISADASVRLANSSAAIDIDLPTETNLWADPLTNTQYYGNCIWGDVRLMRCGFAGSKPINRNLSGAAYFGAMEMAGNAGEFVVGVISTSHAAAALYTGANGNGDISDVPDNWPDYTNAPGVFIKGGHYKSTDNNELLICHMLWGRTHTNNVRNYYQGGRGALSF